MIWGRQEFVPSSSFGKNLLCLTYECRLGEGRIRPRGISFGDTTWVPFWARGGPSLPPFLPAGRLGH